MKYRVSDDKEKVYMVDDDGSEQAVDPSGLAKENARLVQSGAELASENKAHRKSASARGKKLEEYEAALGDNSLQDAVSALETVGSMDEKHQLDVKNLEATLRTGYGEKIKGITEGYEAKNKELTDGLSAAQGDLFEERHLNRFLGSDIISKTIYRDVPRDAFAIFRGHCKLDGTYVDSKGAPIVSIDNIGQPADFEESMKRIIDERPDKDKIWRGANPKGGGGHLPGNAGVNDGQIPDRSPRANIAAGLAKRQNS